MARRRTATKKKHPSKAIEKDCFVVDDHGRVSLVMEVEREPKDDVSGRYTLQFVDGSKLFNAPGYLLKLATDEQVKAALDAQKKLVPAG